MLTREAIEQVFGKHFGQFSPCRAKEPCDDLITEILALQPPVPSLKALEDFIEQSGVRFHGVTYDAFVKWVTAWSTGRGEPKWCEHMDGLDHLTFDYGWHSYPIMAKEMMVCPRCGTKRPEAR